MDTRSLKAVKLMTRERVDRERRQAAAGLQWGDIDPATRQRSAMVAAAFLLDEAGCHNFADWLLLARPEHARAVATGVAVHAIRHMVPAAWDVLMSLDAADLQQASNDLSIDATFAWSPAPSHLYEGE